MKPILIESQDNDIQSHCVDAFRYSIQSYIIRDFYSKVENFIREVLATKIYPTIKKPYGKFWMKIMLWVRGVKIIREEKGNLEIVVTIKQFGRVIVSETFKSRGQQSDIKK